MKRSPLGKTGIDVTPVCFGTLPIGPLQKNLSLKDGVALLEHAVERGINFFDTAKLYRTYPYLKELLKKHPDLIVCSRSYDYSYDGLMDSLEEALRGTGRDYIDLFLLHEQESEHTFRGHWDAVEALLKAKEQGKIRATGISTHRVRAVKDSGKIDSFDVVFPMINKDGLGIEDGTARDMLGAIRSVRDKKGIYAMKIFGGGNLIGQNRACLDYAKRLFEEGLIDSAAIGMRSVREIDANVDFFEGLEVGKTLEELRKEPRELFIEDWCEGCGRCVARCHQNALYLKDKKAHVDRKRCLTCGYCSSVCPQFCLKII